MFEITVSFLFGVCWGIVLTLRIVKRRSYDGNLVVRTKEDSSKMYSLELNDDPETFEKKKSIVFKVSHEEPLKPSIKVVE